MLRVPAWLISSRSGETNPMVEFIIETLIRATFCLAILGPMFASKLKESPQIVRCLVFCLSGCNAQPFCIRNQLPKQYTEEEDSSAISSIKTPLIVTLPMLSLSVSSIMDPAMVRPLSLMKFCLTASRGSPLPIHTDIETHWEMSLGTSKAC